MQSMSSKIKEGKKAKGSMKNSKIKKMKKKLQEKEKIDQNNKKLSEKQQMKKGLRIGRKWEKMCN